MSETKTTIRETTPEDIDPLLKILEDSSQFDADGLAHISNTLDDHFAHPDNALWYTALINEPVGVAYCTQEPVTSGTWNLLLLWVMKGAEGKGIGSSLVNKIESDLVRKSARLLIVETSGMKEYEKARSFYTKSGFIHEATIENFFDVGDDKLVYTKTIQNKS